MGYKPSMEGRAGEWSNRISKTKSQKQIMKSDVVVVLAGNHEQFHFMEKDDRKTYYYVDRPEKLYSLRYDEVVTTGTFWDRPDSNDLYKEATYRLNR